jgi:hypothetical protein
VPTEFCVKAIEPVFASGDVDPIGMDTTRPDTVPVTVASGVPVDADVGLPPQPTSEPSATKEAAWQAPLQNLRRDVPDSESNAMPAPKQES